MNTIAQPSASQAATKELKALCQINKSHRKIAWHQRLMTCLPHAVFTSSEPEIIFNSAGFTYFNLEFSEDVQNEDAHGKKYTLPSLIDAFLIQEGVGVVIEARKPELSIDLSYGDILGFHLHRTFAEPDAHPFQTTFTRAKAIQPDTEILVQDVPPNLLPEPTLALLLAVMQHFGIAHPKVQWVLLPETKQQELVFSFDPKAFSSEQIQLMLKKLGWFLPRYYSYLCCDLTSMTYTDEQVH